MSEQHESPCVNCGQWVQDPHLTGYVRCDECYASIWAYLDLAAAAREEEQRRRAATPTPAATVYDLWQDGDLQPYADGKRDKRFEQAQAAQLFKNHKPE